jgi:hypothetical protein
VGYAPQVMMAGDTPYIVVGRMFQSAIWLSDLDLEITADVEGSRPRAAEGKNGTSWVVYMNHNRNLVLGRISDGGIEERDELATVAQDFSVNGRVPWDLAMDEGEVAHLVFEDSAQGRQGLVYKTGGKTGQEQIITERLSRELHGNGLYDITADLCGRSTVAMIEDPKDDAAEESPLLITYEEYRPVLRVIRWI